jgi:hypothetical protein
MKEKRQSLQILVEHHIVALEEHIRVFFLAYLVGKNSLCAVGEGA